MLCEGIVAVDVSSSSSSCNCFVVCSTTKRLGEELSLVGTVVLLLCCVKISKVGEDGGGREGKGKKNLGHDGVA